MRPRLTELTRWMFVALAIGAASACIIGPKQDDPIAGAPNMESDASADTNVADLTDTGAFTASPDTGEKTSDAVGGDVSPPPQDAASDTGACASDADAACGDAVSDSPDAPDSPEGG
jgi:hypothetical protein